jgi:hypothetical protein
MRWDVSRGNSTGRPPFSHLICGQDGRPVQGCRRSADPINRTTEKAVTSHKFKIGQSVNYTSGPFGASASGVYEITQLLPPEGDDFQYKIKSAREPHERVAKESQLDRV